MNRVFRSFSSAHVRFSVNKQSVTPEVITQSSSEWLRDELLKSRLSSLVPNTRHPLRHSGGLYTGCTGYPRVDSLRRICIRPNYLPLGLAEWAFVRLSSWSNKTFAKICSVTEPLAQSKLRFVDWVNCDTWVIFTVSTYTNVPYDSNWKSTAWFVNHSRVGSSVNLASQKQDTNTLYLNRPLVHFQVALNFIMKARLSAKFVSWISVFIHIRYRSLVSRFFLHKYL